MYTVAPYEVLNERPGDETFNRYDQVWVKAFLVPPGPNSYFIYYRFDELTDFRGQINTQIPVRSLKTHYYNLPLSNELPPELVVK